MSSRIYTIRICEYCNKEFTARTTKTRFCSKKCNSAAYKAKQRRIKIENSEQQTKQIAQQHLSEITQKEYLSVSEASLLVGLSRRTFYNLIQRNSLPIYKIGTRTILKRSDLDKLFQYSSSPLKRQDKPVTEYYTVKEIEDKFFIKYRRLNTILKKNSIPNSVQNGKLYISKPHIERYFKRTRKDPGDISDWYTVNEIQEKYKLTREQVYSRVHDNDIPKQRIGKHVRISKQHFDQLFIPKL